jgi:exosortase/archaeosortase family protein
MATGNLANSVNPVRPGFGFAVGFICAATLVAGLIVQLPQAVFAFSRNLTIILTTSLGSLLGLSMTSNADIITVNGFAMTIINQCTAFNYIIILALAILLYTRHTLKYRLAGVVIATLILLIANAVRLIVTGMVGTVSLEAFHFVHEYLWVALFALLVFGIWKVWADGGLKLNRQALRHAGVVAVSCTAVFLLLLAFKQLHCRLLASLASPMFRLLLGDSHASLIWDGSLQFTQGVTKVRMGLFFEMANVAVYVGIMLPYLWRNRKAIPIALLGLVVLVVMYAEFIAIMGVNAINDGKATAELFQFIGSSIFLSLPMALYWMVTCTQGKDMSNKGK